jgi:chemotaxis protein histidine kinase CheA
VQKREQAEQQGLKDAADIFKQIEKGSDELAKNDKVDRKQAALKLNDLAQQLEQRKNQLGGRDELEKQLNSMKDFGQGPAEKIASAVKQGDWSKAVDELNKLKEQVASGELSDEKKEQLQQQLDKMQNKLAEAAQAHSDAMQDMKEQIDQQKQNGDLAKAAELQQQIDKLAAQKPQMDNLQQLADKLGQCQDCMQQGDAEGAAQSLDQLADQLGQMQQELGEMEMLDEALEQIEAAKQAMDCGECNGAGCEACQGQGGAPGQKPGDGQGQKNEGQDQQGGQGPGIGTGRGNAAPGQGDDTTATRDSRVRQKPGQGAAVFGGLVEGPNVRGASNLAEQEVGGQLNAEPADPLTAERLSRPRREHAEEYFDKLREEL